MFITLAFHEVRPEKEFTGKQIPIMVHDRYKDSLPLALFDNLQLFENRIDYLKENNYHFLTLDEVKSFYQKKTIPKKSVLLTFDDCYQSLKEYVYPLLKKKQINATAFIVSGWLFPEQSLYERRYSKVLSRPELKEMQDVFEYANHTCHFHERNGSKTSKAMWKPIGEFYNDLKKCNETKLITQKDVFAYPFGIYDQSIVNAIKMCNFQLAFTTIPGTNNLHTNHLELKRNIIPSTMTMQEFSQLMARE